MLNLDPNAPWFGAKGGGRMITLKAQEDIHPRFLRCFFFVLYDERFGPEGKAFGKVSGLHMDGPAIGHVGGMEARMLLFLEKQSKSDPGLKTLNLPETYWASEHVPITCSALGDLPMIAWGRRVYPHCAVTICEWYSCAFNAAVVSTFATDESQLRVLLFEVIHTLAELQRRYKFQHNDLHKDNILLHQTEGTETFPEKRVQIKRRVGRSRETIQFCIPERNVRPVLWDFAMSVLHASETKVSIPNECGAHDSVGPEWCVPQTYVPGYDIHGLLMNILPYVPEGSEAHNFIHSLYPEELIYIPQDEDYEEIEALEEQKDQGDEDQVKKEDDGDVVESTDDGLSQQENRFKNLLLYLNSHELITQLPQLKIALSDALELTGNQVLPTNEDTYENDMIDKFGDVSISHELPALCYGHNASFMDYWYYLYPAEDRKRCIEHRKKHLFQFASPDSKECLAAYKICKKAWETRHLPTPHDILLHSYFESLRVSDEEQPK